MDTKIDKSALVALIRLVDAAEEGVKLQLSKHYDSLAEYCGPDEALRLINDRDDQTAVLRELISDSAHLTAVKMSLLNMSENISKIGGPQSE